MSITSATPNPVTASGNLTYVVAVTNNGPSDVPAGHWHDVQWFDSGEHVFLFGRPTVFLARTGQTFTFNPALNTINPGNHFFTSVARGLTKGTTIQVTLIVTVSPNVPNPTNITNLFTAALVTSTTVVDPVPGNNDATNAAGTSSVPVAFTADVTLSNSLTVAPKPTFTPPSNLAYSFTVTNAGPSAANGVTLTFPIPAGTTFVSLQQSGGTAPLFTIGNPSGGQVLSTLTALPAGATANFTGQVFAPSSMANNTVINETVSVTASGSTDPVPTNNSSIATTTANALCDVYVQDFPQFGNPVAGNDLDNTIVVTNNTTPPGPVSDAVNPVLSITMPPTTKYVGLVVPTWLDHHPATGGRRKRHH